MHYGIKTFEEMKKQANAPIEHLFDNHKFCDASWCYRKREIENGVSKGNTYHISEK